MRFRGREQQLIDSYGVAQSDTKPAILTENSIRGVGKDHAFGKLFHRAANFVFRQELHPYTGDPRHEKAGTETRSWHLS